MGSPGYLYLVGRDSEDGEWVKVGVAARIGRVLQHKGWTMLVRTFEKEWVLSDPQSVEQRVLQQFPESRSNSRLCEVCGAEKPPVGRTGEDGLTEIRHVKCHPGIREFFEQEWTRADREPGDSAWSVDFDPRSLRPTGMVAVGPPWRQPPRQAPKDYGPNMFNVLCVRGVAAQKILAFLDGEWEKGASDLRACLWKKYGECVCNGNGTPTWKANGTGVRGGRADVEAKLTKMAELTDVEVVFVTVRKPGLLYAYARNATECADATSVSRVT